MAERVNFTRDCFCESFRRNAGSHKEITPLLRVLQVGEVNDRRRRITEIDDTRVLGDANDFVRFGSPA